jgi:hypothetical protein
MREFLRARWRSWRGATLGDKVHAIVAPFTLLALVAVLVQLRQNDATNRVAIRGQLYDRESGMASEEAADETHKLTTIWATTPPNVTKQAYARTLLELVTTDPAALASRNPEQLFGNLFGAAVFRDRQRNLQTKDLRRLFLDLH